MDRFLKSGKQNSKSDLTRMGRSVCIIGKSGIGKTWAVSEAYQGRFIDLNADILKTKQKTIDFLERARSSDLPVVIDEYEALCDLVGMWEIKGPPSQGQFIIISQIPVKFDFPIEIWNFPVPTFSDIKRIIPDAPDDLVREANGDIRHVIQGMNFKSDAKDAFETPRDFLAKLISKNTKHNPADYIGHHLSEPGNIVAIIQENYIDSREVDYAKVSELISVADIFDVKLYEGQWGMLAYYSLFGCIYPAYEIGHTIDTSKLRPGSVWTKHQNMCMRAKRIAAMAKRQPWRELSLDDIILLKSYAEVENVEMLKAYGIEPQDLDVMNHLSTRKIKARTLSSLKKCLAASATVEKPKKNT
jgi:hypothetical protein